MEQIIIGSGIRITVLKLERNQVRIGIEAPTETPILRAELLQTEPVSARGEESADLPSSTKVEW